jgi:hypothetical protein
MSVRVTGKLTLQLIHEDGSEEVFEATNLVHTQGKGHITYRQAASPIAGPINYMAVGTGNTPPALTDASLVAEVARVTASSVTAAGNVWTMTATFPPGVGTGALQEAGVYDTPNPLATTAMARSTFAVANKGAGDTLNISWTVTIG